MVFLYIPWELSLKWTRGFWHSWTRLLLLSDALSCQAVCSSEKSFLSTPHQYRSLWGLITGSIRCEAGSEMLTVVRDSDTEMAGLRRSFVKIWDKGQKEWSDVTSGDLRTSPSECPKHSIFSTSPDERLPLWLYHHLIMCWKNIQCESC